MLALIGSVHTILHLPAAKLHEGQPLEHGTAALPRKIIVATWGAGEVPGVAELQVGVLTFELE